MAYSLFFVVEITEIDGTDLKFDRKKLGARDMGEWCSEKKHNSSSKSSCIVRIFAPAFLFTSPKDNWI